MATHSSILVWESPWTEKPSELQVYGVARVRHNSATKPHHMRLEIDSLDALIQQMFTELLLLCATYSCAHRKYRGDQGKGSTSRELPAFLKRQTMNKYK